MTMRELKDFLFQSSSVRNSRMQERDYKVRIDSMILDETYHHRYQNIIIILSCSAPMWFSLGTLSTMFQCWVTYFGLVLTGLTSNNCHVSVLLFDGV
jgi:hypothetical protein